MLLTINESSIQLSFYRLNH